MHQQNRRKPPLRTDRFDEFLDTSGDPSPYPWIKRSRLAIRFWTSANPRLFLPAPELIRPSNVLKNVPLTEGMTSYQQNWDILKTLLESTELLLHHLSLAVSQIPHSGLCLLSKSLIFGLKGLIIVQIVVICRFFCVSFKFLIDCWEVISGLLPSNIVEEIIKFLLFFFFLLFLQFIRLRSHLSCLSFGHLVKEGLSPWIPYDHQSIPLLAAANSSSLTPSGI